jgi:hypothetical protein
MAPTYVGAGLITSGGGNATHTATPGLPSTGILLDGDYLLAAILWLSRSTTTPVITASAGGWIQVTSDFSFGVGRFATYGVPYTPGMAAPEFGLFFGTAGISTYVARVFAFRGVNLASPEDAESALVVDTGTVATYPTVTTTGTERLQVAFASKSAQSTGSSGPSGYTAISPISNHGAGDDASFMAHIKAIPAAGVVPAVNPTMGGTSGTILGKTLALNPGSSDLVIAPELIDPAETETLFWAPVVTQSSDQVVAPGFIATAEAVYAPVVSQGGVTPVFLESQEQVFVPTVEVILPSGEPEEPMILQRFSAEVFPPGAIVTIHEAHRAGIDRSPEGRALSQSTVNALGQFQVTGTAPGKWYVAYAVVAGKHRYLRFRSET